MIRITEDSVHAVLRQVEDPELLINIVDLGLIYEIALAEHGGKCDVHVKMTMTSPGCPAGPELVREAKEAIRDLGEQIGEVTVEVVMNPPWTPDRMTDEARDELGIF
ncbi:MAG: metal-sulfur cluster assembly factor [Pirellulales bacterium]|jgi:metal-sulfur cluster biosynthetic enzyme|nr:metal-sulfur cluster assembly factor [Thermoguttaceae bacterium]MDD4787788.1 metal-sulfur cluster assembly factor [Pirellulales bacterium]MDI9443297.1 metal-sulfur cluster assembly factor [Planctomycetota bacterium]NLZ01880.1 metal-sulfur cluster assembly factor [Pirellulaceae bacterium]